MATVRRRALWGWLAGLFILAAMFAWSWSVRPTVPGASAAVVGRGGMLLLAGIFPVFLGGRAIARFTADNVVAAIALPMFLAVGLSALIHMFAFIPEDARLCRGLARYGDALVGPECYTAAGTRLALLAEGYGIWVLFGVVLWASFRMRDRSERKRLAAVRA